MGDSANGTRTKDTTESTFLCQKDHRINKRAPAVCIQRWVSGESLIKGGHSAASSHEQKEKQPILHLGERRRRARGAPGAAGTEIPGSPGQEQFHTEGQEDPTPGACDRNLFCLISCGEEGVAR